MKKTKRGLRKEQAMGRCVSRLGLVAVIVAVFSLIMSWGPGSGTVRANGDAGAVFTAGPDMTVARMAHHNLSFPDGSAMVLGGHGTGFKVLDGAEQWHPTSNSFSSLKMNFFHDFGALAWLSDARLLLAGGAADLGVAPGYDTAEIFDPMDNSFSTTGKMKYPRMNCAAATLTSGKTLVVGGWYDANSPKYGEVFDPATEVFTATKALNTPRAVPLVLPAADGEAVVLGGLSPYGMPYVEQFEVYGPADNGFWVKRESLFAAETGWVVTGPFARPVEDHRMADGRYLYLAYRYDGSAWLYTLFTFDPETRETSRFETTPALPNSGQVSFVQPVVDAMKNQAYLLGIVASGTQAGQIRLYSVDLATGERNDPVGGHALASDHYLGYAGLALLSDGRILISGGHSKTGNDTNFSPIAKTLFVTIPEANVPRAIIEANPVKGPVPLSVDFTAVATGGTPPYSYAWDLDGDTLPDETSQNFSYTYTEPGTYQVTLTVIDSAERSATDTLQVRALSAPFVEASATPVSGKPPLKVSFSAASSDVDGKIVRYQWDVNGDGKFDSSSKKTAARSYTYKKKGTYQAVIQVTDNHGLTARDEVTIEVGTPPVIKASASPISGSAPLKVAFTGKATDADGQVKLYEWDFDGDGAFDWKKIVNGNVKHTYTESGVYNATLRVKDNSGLTEERSFVISVASAPKALPSAYPTTGQVPLTVTFFSNGSDADGSPEYYDWDYDGDGVFDERRFSSINTTHTYSQPGIYQAALKVTDNAGLTGSATVTIMALDPNPEGYPIVTAEAFPAVGGRPLKVALRGHAHDSDGTVVLYEWDFDGDGGFDWQEKGWAPGLAGTVIDAQSLSRPVFVDLDHDGDMDLVLGNAAGNVLGYRNDGTDKGPVWTAVGALKTADDSPVKVGSNSVPAFGDLDGDGDSDLLVGEQTGKVFFYRNTGTAQVPQWSLVGPLADAGGTVISANDSLSAPALADLDNDGDLDLCLGNGQGTIILYRNTGTPASSQWVLEGTLNDASAALVDVGSGSVPVFADLDDDQDLDLMIGEYYGTVILYRNTGTGSVPQWSLQGALVDGGGTTLDVGWSSTPALADLDEDGDLDLFIGEWYGKVFLFENKGTKTASLWEFRSARYNFVGGQSQARPALGDLDGDGDLDLLVGEGSGKIAHYLNASEGGIPSWMPAGFLADGGGNAVSVASFSSPALADTDGDGDLDLYVGAYNGTIACFQNTGTPTLPQWLSTGTLSDGTGTAITMSYHAAPTFADLDGDGDLDLIVGDWYGGLFLFRNDGTPTAAVWTAAGQLAAGAGNITVGYSAVPAFTDADGDGDLDLYVGAYSGKITFYRNEGDLFVPLWNLQDSDYSSVSLPGWTTPAFGDFDEDGDDDLLVGSMYGDVYFYPTFGCTSRVYDSMGTFNAVLRVSDDEDLTAVASVEVRVLADGSPTVEATADPVSGAAPLTVSLDGRASDPKGAIVLYEWDFEGDGTFDWSHPSSPKTSHVYDKAGTFAATLRVHDSEGQKATASVTVKPAAGVATTRTGSFNPSGGQKANICSTFTDDVQVTVSIVDGAGTLVRTLVDHASRTRNTQTCDEWNGLDEAGKKVLDGIYYFLIQYTAGGETFILDLKKSAEFKQVWPSRTWPSSFNPYEDKPVEISFTLGKPSEVSLYFWTRDYSRPDSIAPVRTLFLREPFGEGSHKVVWDGVDDRGVAVKTAVYPVTIRSYELPDNAVIVTGNRPVITAVAADPNYFGSGYNPYNVRSAARTRVSFSLSRPADLEVRIFDSFGAVVRAMTMPGLPAGTGSLSWDGRDQSGNTANPGSYSIALIARDDIGNRSLTRYAVVMLTDWQ